MGKCDVKVDLRLGDSNLGLERNYTRVRRAMRGNVVRTLGGEKWGNVT